MKIKTGTVREDGYVFRGYQKRGDRTYEHWVSPATVAKDKARVAAHSKKVRAAIYADPERLHAYRRYARDHAAKQRRENPVSGMLTRARIRAKEKGLPFDLSREDIEIPDVCPVLGLPLRVADGSADDSSPELDRVDNRLGYVRGNVLVVSRRANRIKNDATPDELAAVASYYSALQAAASSRSR